MDQNIFQAIAVQFKLSYKQKAELVDQMNKTVLSVAEGMKKKDQNFANVNQDIKLMSGEKGTRFFHAEYQVYDTKEEPTIMFEVFKETKVDEYLDYLNAEKKLLKSGYEKVK